MMHLLLSAPLPYYYVITNNVITVQQYKTQNVDPKNQLNVKFQCDSLLGKTHTLMSSDGVCVQVVEKLFKRIHLDKHHDYKVNSIKNKWLR